jgi:hypothetical protein
MVVTISVIMVVTISVIMVVTISVIINFLMMTEIVTTRILVMTMLSSRRLEVMRMILIQTTMKDKVMKVIQEKRRRRERTFPTFCRPQDLVEFARHGSLTGRRASAIDFT